MGLNVVFAPHLDDEVIGCYSIWDKIDFVIYFKKDYREEIVLQKITDMKNAGAVVPAYFHIDNFKLSVLTEEDTIYLPSKYDFHPLHREVRNKYLLLPGKKMFYSIDMNTPWNEEEENPEAKLGLLQHLYPGEDLFEKNAKYYLFKSVKPYDELCFKEFNWEYQRVKITIQVFDPLEKGLFAEIKNILKPIVNTSSEITIFRTLQHHFPNRKIKIEFNLWGDANKIIE